MEKFEYNGIETILKFFADDVSELNNKIYTHEIPLNQYEYELEFLIVNCGLRIGAFIKEQENEKIND